MLIVVQMTAASARAWRNGEPSEPARLLAEAGAALRPMHPGVEDEALDRYFCATLPDGVDTTRLVEALRRLAGVTAAYLKPHEQPAWFPVGEPASESEAASPGAGETPDFTERQGYLDQAPRGVDARFAWQQRGGGGAGVKLIDIEGAWRFSHEDLRDNKGGIIGGTPTDKRLWRNHGTAVIGVLGGDRNTFGVTGLCPDAHISAVSIFGGTGSAGAVVKAATALSPGDILIIELHRPGPHAGHTGQAGYIPIEWWPDDLDAIRFATRRGVLVIEAGGNGSEDLDHADYDVPPEGFPESWQNPFRRGEHDSGAILIGAGAPPPGTHGRDHGPDRSRLGFSNYGSALDAQGWGREVTTCGYGDLQGGRSEDAWYTDTFAGTSSASPVVAGALGCIQGILRARGDEPLTPARARALLRATGAPQSDAPERPSTQRIGNRPDLRQALAQLDAARPARTAGGGSELSEAALRVAARQLLLLARAPLGAAVARQMAAVDRPGEAQAWLDTPLGRALLGSALSLSVSSLPGEIPALLARELRVAALCGGLDDLAALLREAMARLAVPEPTGAQRPGV